MADKLREARQLYAEMGAAAGDLERAGRSAAESYRELGGQLDAAARGAQAACAALEAETNRARAALRWPWWAALAFTAWGAFLGALLGGAVRNALAGLIRALW